MSKKKSGYALLMPVNQEPFEFCTHGLPLLSQPRA
jgi:hypothetical protein